MKNFIEHIRNQDRVTTAHSSEFLKEIGAK